MLEGPLPAAQRDRSKDKLQCACHALVAELAQGIRNKFLLPDMGLGE